MKKLSLFLFLLSNIAYPLSLPDQAQLGANSRNYIKNGGAENGRAGWITYADAAGTSPVDCTGGSPSSTWTVSGTTPLSGTNSFLWTHSANNRQGEGASYAFTIDNADQARLMEVGFDYEVASGAFVAGVVPIGGATAVDSDLEVYVYDVTNTTLIQPSNFRLLQKSGKSTFRGTFQTASNSTSYRLCVHAATTSASAHTVRVDSVRVGPQVTATGPPVTDWTAYTPTFTGFGTAASIEFFYRRVGDSLEIQGSWTTGTCTATEARVSLPTGITSADTSKITSIRIAGNRTRADSSAEQSTVLIEPSVGYLTFGRQTVAVAGLTKQNASAIFGDAQKQTLLVSIPISGWASNVAMGADADGRVVVAQATGNAASAASGNPLIFPTVGFDTHGQYSASTGRYTVSVPGYYRIHGSIISANAAVGLNAYVNAVSGAYAGTTDSNGEGTFSVTVSAKSGDLIDIRPNNTLDPSDGAITFERISGLAQIAASEKIYLQYTGNAGGVQTGGTTNVDFATKVVDSHGTWTSNNTFTAPRAGFYIVSGMVKIAANTDTDVTMYKSGSAIYLVQGFGGGTTHTLFPFNGAIYLLAGEAITFRMGNNCTLSNSATQHWLSIYSL